MKTKKEALEFMKKLALEIKWQDNRSTGNPIFEVHDSHRVYIPEDTVRSFEINYDTEIHAERYEWKTGFYYLERRKSNVVTWSFLTHSAAQRAIDRKRHDLHNPSIYVNRNWYNSEFVNLIKAVHILADVEIDWDIYH